MVQGVVTFFCVSPARGHRDKDSKTKQTHFGLKLVETPQTKCLQG
jgi:hypothetical protein